jgi:hypothetical protein
LWIPTEKQKPFEQCWYDSSSTKRLAVTVHLTLHCNAAFAWTLRMIPGMSRSKKTSPLVTTRLNFQKTPNCFIKSTCAYVVVWVGGLEVWELMILW